MPSAPFDGPQRAGQGARSLGALGGLSAGVWPATIVTWNVCRVLRPLTGSST